LRFMEYGKVAVTLVDTLTERAVRVRPHRLARLRAAACCPTAASRWHAQLDGYQRLPIDQLVCYASVRLAAAPDLLGPPTHRVECSACGEEVMNARYVRVGTQCLCRPCAGSTYYQPESQPCRAIAA
jgi:formylmethanofuran dehydrogenase subunit E